MQGEQSHLRLGGHQNQPPFIQQTSGLIPRGVPLEVFQQIPQWAGRDVPDENAYGVTSGILHRREHLDTKVHSGEPGCGGHPTEGIWNLVQVGNVDVAGSTMKRLLKVAACVVESCEQGLAHVPRR